MLGAGVAKALLGKDVLPDDLPFVTGSIGLLGTRPSYELMRDCDTLLIVGSNFPYSQFLPEFGKARAVQIDIDGALIGMRYPYRAQHRRRRRRDVARAAAAAGAAHRPGVAGDGRGERRRLVGHDERQSMVDADPVNPMRIVWEMSQAAGRRIVAADSGSVANWYAKVLRMRAGMRGSLSGTLATMGAGGAVRDRRQVRPPGPAGRRADGRRRHADERDGRAADVGRYRERWADQRLIVCVLHNNDLNQVTWELRAMGGAPSSRSRRCCPTSPTRTSPTASA